METEHTVYLFCRSRGALDEARAAFSSMEGFRRYCEGRDLNPADLPVREVKVLGPALADKICVYYGQLEGSEAYEMCGYTTRPDILIRTDGFAELRYVPVPMDPAPDEPLAPPFENGSKVIHSQRETGNAGAAAARRRRGGVASSSADEKRRAERRAQAEEEIGDYQRHGADASLRELIHQVAIELTDTMDEKLGRFAALPLSGKIFFIGLALLVVALLIPKPDEAAVPTVQVAEQVEWLPLAAKNIRYVELPGRVLFEADLDARTAAELLPRHNFRVIQEIDQTVVERVTPWENWERDRDYIAPDAYADWRRINLERNVRYGYQWRDPKGASTMVYDLETSRLHGNLTDIELSPLR